MRKPWIPGSRFAMKTAKRLCEKHGWSWQTKMGYPLYKSIVKLIDRMRRKRK